MGKRTASYFVMGIVWASAAVVPLFANDVCAQATQEPKDQRTKAKAETQADVATSATTAAPDASQATTRPDTAGAAGAAAPGDATNPGTTAAAVPPGGSSTESPSAETPAASPQPPVSETSSADASSGSGLFEQSQSAAAAPTAAGAPSEAQEPRSFDLGGYVRGGMFVGKDPDSNQGQIKAGYGELALKFRAQKEQFGDAYAELRLRDGLQGAAHNLFLDLREAYVNGYFGPLDLRLGKQIIVWGRADAFNPTNNLTPNDLRVRSPIEDDRRVGNIGARAFLNFAPFRLEGVWMPLYVASELPAYKLPPAVYFGDTNYPAPNVNNGLASGRLHLELSAVEMSASFVHGYAPLPGLALQNLTVQRYYIGGFDTQILISKTAYEQNVAGFDFSTAIGDILGVRGEAAYRRPVDYQNPSRAYYTPHPDVQYVVGLDHTFGSVSIIAQYLGRYIFNWHKEYGPATAMAPSILQTYDNWVIPAGQKQQIDDTIHSTLAQKNQIIFGQTAQVQHLSSLRVEWLTLNETLSFSALGLINFTTREWMAYPKISYKISDRLSTAIGAEIYWGPDDTLFGLIKESLSAGYAELKYAF